MIEKIGNVQLNLSAYKGADLYSDGPVEDEMLEMAQKGIRYLDDSIGNVSWPVYYHFSAQRTNIISWLPIEPTHRVLEIGSGCGAVTGKLAEMSGRVQCVELSKKRSLINAHRHREQDNIEIAVSNFLDFKDAGKYDWITLIGVLEYANLFMNEEDSFAAMLRRLKNFLIPGGRMVIAIENKLGLKYWAGCKEDHTGSLFEGLQGYPNSAVNTFSRKELIEILASAGFAEHEFYYPYPDYKFVSNIFSERFLPGIGSLRQNMNNFDQTRLFLFDESQVWDQIVSAGLFPEFSNSFLVLCS
ncbi:MAG: class I SAM-dependent methyltransferase [Oscillospiraceae bacterium]|nr:class I SAM-dependent methyltransferase [Oscillospiraceae bacterium]